jgi:hypothetical protein
MGATLSMGGEGFRRQRFEAAQVTFLRIAGDV